MKSREQIIEQFEGLRKEYAESRQKELKIVGIEQITEHARQMMHTARIHAAMDALLWVLGENDEK